MDPFDFVIVGGGSAGAVVAARLSEDPGRRVLLLEAGQDTPPEAVPADIADTFPGSYGNRAYFWPGLQASGVAGGPRRAFTQARVMGGGSSLMGMWALRGLPADYDAWARAGARGWAWDDVLPYFARLERDLDCGGNAHGADGPVPIRRVPGERWPGMARAFADAASRRGYPARPDLNGGDEDGVFPLPFTQDAGVRASSAHCYLTAQVRRRPNLSIQSGTRVTGLTWAGNRVTGVHAEREGEVREITARETILCAGAIHSPALLLRAGIGPAAALRALGIEVRADLAGVGANLQNHAFLHIGVTIARAARQDAALRNYGIAVVRATSSLGEPGDIMIGCIGRISTGVIGTRAGAVTANLYAPFSRGAVTLDAAGGPDAPPRVEFRLLDDARDLARMVEAANLAGALLCDPALAAVCPDAFMLPPEPPLQKLNRPGPLGPILGGLAATLLELPAPLRGAALARVFGAERMLDRARSPLFAADLVRASTAPMFHAAGTCAMGVVDDPAAVVGPDCRVRGMGGLRVIDASVMPVVPRANTNVPTIMLAERAVDLVRAAPL